MTTDQNKKIVEQLFNEAFVKKNFSILQQVVDSDFVNHGIPGAQKGPEGLKQVIQQFLNAFPDMKINIEHIIAEGDLVATRGYWTGIQNGEFMGMPPTGKPVTVQYSDFWKLSNGKCNENWVQMDMVGMMQQLGMMPPPVS